MAGRFDQSIEHYRAVARHQSTNFMPRNLASPTLTRSWAIKFRRAANMKSAFKKFTVARAATGFIGKRAKRLDLRPRRRLRERRARLPADCRLPAYQATTARPKPTPYRQMAMCEQNPKQALVYLDKAEAAAQEGQNALKIAPTQEMAQISARTRRSRSEDEQQAKWQTLLLRACPTCQRAPTTR